MEEKSKGSQERAALIGGPFTEGEPKEHRGEEGKEAVKGLSHQVGAFVRKEARLCEKCLPSFHFSAHLLHFGNEFCVDFQH